MRSLLAEGWFWDGQGGRRVSAFEVPLLLAAAERGRDKIEVDNPQALQGYLAHKKQPPPRTL